MKQRTPFDQKRPLGYLTSLSAQLGGTLCAVAVMAAVNSMFLTICWYNDALVNDVISGLRRMNAAFGWTTSCGLRQLRAAVLFHNEIIR